MKNILYPIAFLLSINGVYGRQEILDMTTNMGNPSVLRIPMMNEFKDLANLSPSYYDGLRADTTSTPIIFSTIAQLLQYGGKRPAIVTDKLRGGNFKYYSPGSGVQKVDSGMVFYWRQAYKVINGGYWIRVIPESGNVDVAYWCKKDGVSDETFALRNALTYAATSGTKIFWGSGTYLVSGNITNANSITSSGLVIEFGTNVKIIVTGKSKFTYPDDRVLFFYGTSDIPHSFSMAGGSVEIDGRNLIRGAICTSSEKNINRSFIIDCVRLKIKNCYSGATDVKSSFGLYTYGSYENMIIRNVFIDTINRDVAVNNLDTQAMLVAHQSGKTLIENCDIENIGNSSLTKDCDALVVRGDNTNIGEFVNGDFTIKNCTFKNSRGRHIKGQSSNVKVYNCDFWQTTIRFFPNGSSIDFQIGNGDATGNRFHYPLVGGVSAFEGSAIPIAFQNRQTGKKMVSICRNNIVRSQSQFYSLASFTASGNTNSAGADFYCENNQVLPWDSAVKNIITRDLVEMNIDNLEAMPSSSVWSIYIRNNTLMTNSQLLSYTGYTGANIGNKLEFVISGNTNLSKGTYLFSNLSGKRITRVKKYQIKDNKGWSNFPSPMTSID